MQLQCWNLLCTLPELLLYWQLHFSSYLPPKSGHKLKLWEFCGQHLWWEFPSSPAFHVCQQWYALCKTQGLWQTFVKSIEALYAASILHSCIVVIASTQEIRCLSLLHFGRVSNFKCLPLARAPQQTDCFGVIFCLFCWRKKDFLGKCDSLPSEHTWLGKELPGFPIVRIQ